MIEPVVADLLKKLPTGFILDLESQAVAPQRTQRFLLPGKFSPQVLGLGLFQNISSLQPCSSDISYIWNPERQMSAQSQKLTVMNLMFPSCLQHLVEEGGIWNSVPDSSP